MNLTIDPWIPIVRNNGEPALVSLCKLFDPDGQVRDLAVRPHERIALMRLLICIAQAALNGPVDRQDWLTCCPLVAPRALSYLQRWQSAFELFGDSQRFLQVRDLRKKPGWDSDENEESGSVTKLDLALATGNNTTLFDNAGGAGRVFAAAEVALSLMTFQCFSPGGPIGVAFWNGQETTGNGSSNHAPCLAEGMLHAFVRSAESVLASVHANLLTKTQADDFFGPGRWGKPVWECMPESATDGDSVRNATHTYLGRLIPLARTIWLANDCRSLMLANGLDYPSYADGWREPSATVMVRKVKGEPKRVLLAASVERAAWRELHALTVKSVGQSPGGPASLQNVSNDSAAFDLWAGSLVSNRAKPIDTIESVFHIPKAMLEDESQRIYERGVQHAEKAESRLRRAVSEYHKALGDDLAEAKERRGRIQREPITQFWTELEQALPALLEAAENPRQFGGSWQEMGWGRAVWKTSRAAFERACPHVTPRQLEAYAVGLKALFSMRTEDAEIEEEVPA